MTGGNYKPGFWTGLDYGLDLIMDSLIDCKKIIIDVIEHFNVRIQMNQLQCNRCLIFITCEMYFATCSLAGQPTHTM